MISRDTADDLATAAQLCASEPIRIPGSIQPQGFVLVIEPVNHVVIQVSDNVSDWLGVAPDALLGKSLDQLFERADRLVSSLRSWVGEAHHPYHLGDVQFKDGLRGSQAIAMTAHRSGDVVIAEFEPSSDAAGIHGNLYPMVRTFVGQLQDAKSVEDLCARSVQEIKRISGFGRVKAYRFDIEGNGEVIAEVADAGYPTYLGIRFPASDIPAQARELYIANRIRVIADANYRPSALVPALNPHTGAPLDLSFAALRSVSPVHLQYMRNMRTLASMSISIVVDGKLWGLVSCHDAQPRQVNFQTRTACELLGSVLSLQIETKEVHAGHQRMLGLRHCIVRMLAAMADRDSVRLGLADVAPTFIGFARADGAAVVGEGGCQLLGHTPPREEVEALVARLAERGGQEIFHTDNVGRDLPELPTLAESVSGVLAVAISEIHSHYLIWFKHEHVRTVVWAGRPTKELESSGALSPRQSFERWQETYQGFSTAWDALEIEGVSELRAAVLGIVLRKAEEMAQLADQLKKSNRELEAFSYSVSHDLRAPLRHIAGYAELLGDFDGSRLSERGQRFLDHIGESAKFAGTLVDNLLSFSQMGRSALHYSTVDLGALVEATCREMRPDYQHREVEWRIQRLPTVFADATFMHLALRNLLGNAIKYSSQRERAVIEVGGYESDAEVVVFVRDNGVGFDMEYAGKLFGVFQRLHRMEDFEGTGIGLASVRRIIERHEGRVWAEGELDKGATFFVALPRRTPAASV